MPSFAETVAGARRRVILEALAEASDYRANEVSLKLVLGHFGYTVARDVVRADLQYCERHQLLRTEKLCANGTEMLIATLTPEGQDVAGGIAHEGIARRQPRDC